MGGGTSKTTQVQTYLTDSITNIVNDEITTESTTLNQTGYTNQIIKDVVFQPWDGCPWWQPPRNLTVTQESISAGTIAKSVERINVGDLTNKIANKIEALSANTVNKTKDGMLAFTDDTNLDQKISVSNVTRTNIARRIQDTVNTMITQTFDTQQTISGVKIYMPCGDTIVTQNSVTKVMASVFGKNITETAMASTEIQDWVAKVTGEDTQHSTDPFNSLFNNTAKAIGSVSSAVGTIGSAPIYIAGAVLLIILLSMFGGGGGGQQQD